MDKSFFTIHKIIINPSTMNHLIEISIDPDVIFLRYTKKYFQNKVFAFYEKN